MVAVYTYVCVCVCECVPGGIFCDNHVFMPSPPLSIINSRSCFCFVILLQLVVIMLRYFKPINDRPPNLPKPNAISHGLPAAAVRSANQKVDAVLSETSSSSTSNPSEPHGKKTAWSIRGV